jgi:hypothetical protein
LSQGVNQDTVLAWWLWLGERAPVLWNEIAQGRARVGRCNWMNCTWPDLILSYSLLSSCPTRSRTVPLALLWFVIATYKPTAHPNTARTPTTSIK